MPLCVELHKATLCPPRAYSNGITGGNSALAISPPFCSAVGKPPSHADELPLEETTTRWETHVRNAAKHRSTLELATYSQHIRLSRKQRQGIVLQPQ